MKKICILGSGRQGTAAAYDIIKFYPNCELTFADCNIQNAEKAHLRIKKLLNVQTTIFEISIEKKIDLIKFLSEFDIFLSSVPYEFNPYLTDIAIESKTSMVDLGGHTLNVKKQLKKNSLAENAGITIVPDCGMGPGMNISVALMGIESMDSPEEVYIWDGGLPLKPKTPWNYNLFFNIAGLTNEYDGSAFLIENKKIKEVPCFEYLEELEFEQVGILEAAVTSGGLSTMPWTYEGKLKVLHNKTLRFPGHWDKMNAYRQLGLFSEKKISFESKMISPRDFYHSMLEPQIMVKNPKDICIMRVKVIGKNKSKPIITTIDIQEKYDSITGFLAMEKWTGWHASIMMIEILNGNVNKGAIPIEKALTGSVFHNRSLLRDYDFKIDIK